MTRLVDQGVGGKGLLLLVRNDPAAFRTVSVSYCSHDVYAGANSPDPNNPNTTPDGKPRLTNGLLATKAAIQYAQSRYPTTKTFLHGTSAGSVGTYSVAWSMQLQGIAPAGIVADASLVNIEGTERGLQPGSVRRRQRPRPGAAIAARVHPDLANIDNEVDKLVATGRLTVPITARVEPRRPEHVRLAADAVPAA